MVRWPHVLVLLALLLAVAAHPSAAAPLSTDVETAASAEESWQRLLARTAELRGLPAHGEVSRSVLSREQLHARMAEQFGDARTAEQLAEAARLYQLLGLLEPDIDLSAVLQRFRGDAVDGFYDSRTGEVYVVSDTGELAPLERVVAVHEYTHALQYQNFNLRREREGARGNGDRSLALTTLLEGDATLMMIRYILADFSQDEVQGIFTQAISQASGGGSPTRGLPLVLRETAMFPYNEGATFLMQIVGRDAIRGEEYGAAVNQLFVDPPQSTAQILHPERYLRGQAPERVALGDPESALGAGWHEVQRGVLGELYHRLILQQHLRPQRTAYDDDACAEYDDCCEDWDDCDDYDDDTVYVSWPGGRAERAAEGWAGDGYAFLESDGGEAALVVRTRWDDATEAAEWLDAYAESLRGRYGDSLVTLETAAGHRLWRTPDGMLALDGVGAETVLALAPTAAQARQLATLPADDWRAFPRD
jgi:hypothetical protein